jgi:23S rRNA (guanosine2251-2'-O)-methyltransferase
MPPREGIIYGFHGAEEAVKHQSSRIHHIWTTSHPSERVKRLIAMAREKKVPIQIVDVRALSRIAGNSHHQDVVVEISPYQYSRAEALIENVATGSLFCILDEIQDVTNFAALIRSAEGAGVQGIFIPERRSAQVTATTYKLSSGALEHVRIARAGNLARLIEQIQEKGVRVICADAAAPKMWYEADYTGPIAILVGNEYRGVRRLLKEKSDELVKIPMRGKVQSLNVNVAAAILLYEAIRQRSSKITQE